MKSNKMYFLVITYTYGDVACFSRNSIEACFQFIYSLDISTISSFSVSALQSEGYL